MIVKPCAPCDVAHLHNWRWERPHDALYGLQDDAGYLVACVYLFDLQLVRARGGPLQVCGMGGIVTEEGRRGTGLCTKMLIGVIQEMPYEVDGVILNGRPRPCVWDTFGFDDIGPSPTRPEKQRLWWMSLMEPAPTIGEPFHIEPEGFHW